MKPEETGLFLKKLRLEHKLTQKELAEKIYVTHQAVSSWEKGKTLPDIMTMSLLGDFYNITIDNILLKENPVEVVNEKKGSTVAKKIITIIGLLIALLCISMFFNYARHYVTHLMFTAFLLIPSLLFSFLIRRRNRIVEYGIITGLLLIISIVLFSSNTRFYMMNDTNFYQATEEVEIYYPRSFDEMTEYVQYNYILDNYALIYTKAEANIDVFNLSKLTEVDYTTIDTNGSKVYDVVLMNENIYFSSYDEEIPGEFKLFQLDFETHEYTLLFESNEVLNMYTAFQELYLVSDPMLDASNKVYQYDFDNNAVLEPVILDFPIYGMGEYFTEYDSYYIMSVSNIESSDSINTIALFDYEFNIQHILYEEPEADIHHLITGYGKTLIGTNEGAIYFTDLTYEVLGEGYARYPKIVGSETIRIVDSIYIENFDTMEMELFSNVLFYDDMYYPEFAKFFIQDEMGDFYAIDNEFIMRVESVPYEMDHVLFQNYTRIILLALGVFSYGLFITLGHKKD